VGAQSGTISHASTTAVGTAVRMEGVVKRFGETITVDGVDLEVAEGEFFSMLGPSGVGQHHLPTDDRRIRATQLTLPKFIYRSVKLPRNRPVVNVVALVVVFLMLIPVSSRSGWRVGAMFGQRP
jgi:hypothetical protein